MPGSVIGYDDFWVLPCGAGNEPWPLAVGEGRAHVEVFLCTCHPTYLHKLAHQMQRQHVSLSLSLFIAHPLHRTS